MESGIQLTVHSITQLANALMHVLEPIVKIWLAYTVCLFINMASWPGRLIIVHSNSYEKELNSIRS